MQSLLNEFIQAGVIRINIPGNPANPFNPWLNSCYQSWFESLVKKMATVENCSLADRMDRVYEKK